MKRRSFIPWPLTCLCLLLLTLPLPARAQVGPAAGALDPTFAPAGHLTSINTPFAAVLALPDGRVLAGGDFTYVDNATRQNLLCLQTNGVLDTSFPTLDGAVSVLARQSDGRILLGGGFSTVGGQTLYHLARLEAAGTLDPTFHSGLVRASGIPGGPVQALALPGDGTILIGGTFTTVDGVPRRNLARLLPNGALDRSFLEGLSGINGPIRQILLEPSGQVLIAGKFSRVNGRPRAGFARLAPDGSLDEMFMNGLSGTEADATVYALARQPDGKIILGGSFLQIHGVSRSRLARLHPDGSLDTTFQGQANDWVQCLSLQPDGRLLLGGQFTSVNNASRPYVARLNPDGSLDSSFVVALSGGSYPQVNALALEMEGKVLVAGQFNGAQGQTASALARVWGGSPWIGPLITGQPAGSHTISGAEVAFTVTAAGDPTLQYQWRRDGANLLDDAHAEGAASPRLRLKPVSSSDAGQYTVVISNGAGVVTSSPPARLTVDAPPQLMGPAATQSRVPGAEASFQVTVDGVGPFHCAWWKDGVPLPETGRIQGVQSPILTIHSVVTSDAGQYQVVVSNAFGSTWSGAATLLIPPCHWVATLPVSRGWARRVVVAGQLAYVACTRDPAFASLGGLDMIDVSDPAHPVRRGAFNAQNDVSAVAVSGDRAYLARGYAEPLGMTILNVANPAAPVMLGHYGSYGQTGHGTDVAVAGSTAYLAAGASLRVLDVSSPATPLFLGGWTNSYGSDEVAVSGDYAYLGSSGLHVIQVSDPAHCRRIGGTVAGPLSGVALRENLLYLHGGLGLRIYDVSQPSNVVLVATAAVGGISDLAFAGARALAAGGADGLRLFDLTDPLHPVALGDCPTEDSAQGVAVAGGFAYVADGAAGLSVFALETGRLPEIVEQPSSQVCLAGAAAWLSVSAQGEPPLRYQWSANAQPIPGATNAVLWWASLAPEQTGVYAVAVSNPAGRVASQEVSLTVRVAPRLDVARSGAAPRLGLTGLAGDGYAVEAASELGGAAPWVEWNELILHADREEFTDPTGDGSRPRFYRARLLDFAPLHLLGQTVVATVTNLGPFEVKLTFGSTEYAEDSGQLQQWGTYTYEKTGPYSARLVQTCAGPVDVAGNVSTASLTFTGMRRGAFVTLTQQPNGASERSVGTFVISRPP